jgi:hypothetical protein
MKWSWLIPFVVARQTYKSEKLVRGASTPADAIVSSNWRRILRGRNKGNDG